MKKQKTKQPKLSTESVVQPIVREPGKPHAWEELFEDGEMPTLKSVGYMRDPVTAKYISYVITSKGNSVLMIEASEPDMRQVAEDAAKISFANHFMDAEL